MGVSYSRLRCFEEAVPCFQQALGPASQRPPLLANVLHNLGAALNSVGQFTAAAGYHRLAAGLYGEINHMINHTAQLQVDRGGSRTCVCSDIQAAFQKCSM